MELEKNIVMVRPRGLEPPQDFSHNDLNVARLPVPPWPQKLSETNKENLSVNY